MKNRVPTYPGRVTMTPVSGAANTYDMVRADVPIDAGTPLNKETLLQDSTAALLGLETDATPDDALKALINKLTAAQSEVSTLTTKVNGLITYGTSDLTAGSSNLATGTIYVKYE